MDLGISERVKPLRNDILEFVDKNIVPNERVFTEQINAGDRWQPAPIMEELKERAKKRGLWNFFLPHSERGAGTQQPRLFAPCRNHGHVSDVVGGVQLRRARYRQHGSHRALRQRRTQGTLAEAAAERRNPFRVLHDRAARRVVRRHQHFPRGATRRRRMGAERREVVVVRHRRSALQSADRDVRHRARRSAPLAPVADSRAARHQRHRNHQDANRVRLRRRAARPRSRAFQQRPRTEGQHPARLRSRLRNRPGPPRTGPYPPLHAFDRRRRAGAGTDVPALGFARCVRQTACPNSAATSTRSPTRASTSKWRGC